MSTTALIDADTLVYDAGRAAETPVDLGDGLWSYFAYEHVALDRLGRALDDITEAAEADEIVMVLTDYTVPNWRLSVDPEYKTQRRKHTRRPILWLFLRQYIEENWPTYRWPGLEGDDVLGILMTSEEFVSGDKVCVSIDKDLKTIPGRHYNYGRDTLFEQTEAEADRFHLIQAVAGDPTDGYAGCPGIGMTRAERFLEEGLLFETYLHEFSRGKRKGEVEERIRQADPGSPEEVALSIYLSKGFTEEDFLRNARVARILRDGEYDHDTGEVHLWTP